jgi:hypothetical protein
MFRACRRWRDSSTGHECDRAKHCLHSIHDCLLAIRMQKMASLAPRHLISVGFFQFQVPGFLASRAPQLGRWVAIIAPPSYGIYRPAVLKRC